MDIVTNFTKDSIPTSMSKCAELAGPCHHIQMSLFLLGYKEQADGLEGDNIKGTELNECFPGKKAAREDLLRIQRS